MYTVTSVEFARNTMDATDNLWERRARCCHIFPHKISRLISKFPSERCAWKTSEEWLLSWGLREVCSISAESWWLSIPCSRFIPTVFRMVDLSCIRGLIFQAGMYTIFSQTGHFLNQTGHFLNQIGCFSIQALRSTNWTERLQGSRGQVKTKAFPQ